jgi:hypothetical protein
MPSRHLPPLVLLLSFVCGVSPALACRGAGPCYDRVQQPDVYATVDRPVMVRPGFREVYQREGVVVVRPERFMVRPPRVAYRERPPVVRTVLQEVVVRPAGYAWASSYGPFGERRCRVPVPAEIKVVPREVLVRPGRIEAVSLPPVYGFRQRVVAVRPPRDIVVDHPAIVARERASVLVRRGGVAWLPAGQGW